MDQKKRFSVLKVEQTYFFRTLTEIGPAVFNGGISTLLAILLLVNSKSYVFITFFKVGKKLFLLRTDKDTINKKSDMLSADFTFKTCTNCRCSSW